MDVGGVHRERRRQCVERAVRRRTHPAADVLQEGGRPLGLGQHPELVGRPGQCPGHQLLLRHPSDVDAGEHRIGLAATALPSQRCAQRQPGAQVLSAIQRPARQSLGQSVIAQVQGFLGGGHHRVAVDRGVDLHGQHGSAQSIGGGSARRAGQSAGDGCSQPLHLGLLQPHRHALQVQRVSAVQTAGARFDGPARQGLGDRLVAGQGGEVVV